jgi:predicted CopG family antitoxin
MGHKTISLEDSAYAKLRTAKRPGESFSEVVLRLLDEEEPSFLDFRGLLDEETATRLAEIVARMRREDILSQRKHPR